MGKLLPILLILAILYQAYLTITAEIAGHYPQATYELLWMCFLAWVLKWEVKG